MQALILATDEASRLHPLTEHLPAPLLPVLNRPIMAYALELLVRSGLRDIGVAVYNKAGCIEAHFGAGTGSGAQLTYLLQREPLGSAGSLRWAASELRETFVVLPGDAIVDVDIDAALAFHKSHGGIATVIVHAPRPGAPLAAVAVAPGGRVMGYTEEAAEPWTAPGARVYADTGVYIFEPRILDWIPPRRALDCHSDLLPGLPGCEAVHAYVAEGYWNPIASVPAYHQAQLDALASATDSASCAGAASNGGAASHAGAQVVRYLSVEDRELAPGILAGRHVSVHPSARLIAPVYIGSGSQIERDVELGPGVVIGPNTVIDEGATLRDSSILEGAYVGRFVKVERRVIRGGLVIDADSGESLRVVDPFLLGEVSPRLLVGLLARAADCVGALLLLLLFIPVLALITLALLLSSLFTGQPGRVFELRPRVWWRKTGEPEAPERETYGVLHFRTRGQDGAALPLGAYLERTQLDRLPALLSVLKGDLRLVGVKPLDPAEADRLVEEWQRMAYEAAHDKAAGFTGLWYIRANGADLDETVATDAYYTATRNFLLDLYLLLNTPVVCVRGCLPIRPTPAQLERLRNPQRTVRRSRVERRLSSAAWRRRPTGPEPNPGGVSLVDTGPTNAPGP